MLSDILRSEIDNCDIVSFDIFDTLLVRPYMQPTDTFRHIELLENRPGFADDRIFAERNARLYHPEKEDISLDEIYDLTDPCYRDMKEKELAHEWQTLRVNPRALEIYRYAVWAGKRVIAISDMYLPKAFLTELLQEKGYTRIKQVFVSSSEGVLKSSGRLFQVVCKKIKTKPGKILHIGDNHTVDYNKARQCGLKAYYLPSLKTLLYEENPRVRAFYERHRGNLNISILLGVIAYACATPEQNYWEMFGYQYGGPVVFAYMSWLRKQLKADGISDVLFVARDGYTLKQVFQVLDSDNQFRAAYVYAPRILDVLCHLNYQTAVQLEPNREGLSRVRKIIQYYRDKDPVLKAKTPDKIATCQEGVCFIQKHLKRYQKLAAVKRKEFASYIRPFIRNKQVAMVDTVTGYFSSQRFLSSFAQEMGVKITGYYWFYLTHQREYQLYRCFSFQKSHDLIFADWNIMELIMTAPEPPIDDFQGGMVCHKPLSEEEKQRMNVYPDVSAGCVAFAREMKSFFRDIPINFQEYEIRAWIDEFCTVPTPVDKMMFSKIKHGYDSNHSMYRPLCPAWNDTPFGKRCSVMKCRPFNLFNFIKIFCYDDEQAFKLFGVVPLVRVWKQGKKTKMSLFGIPTLKFVPKIKSGKTRIKVKLFGIPIMVIKKR